MTIYSAFVIDIITTIIIASSATQRITATPYSQPVGLPTERDRHIKGTAPRHTGLVTDFDRTLQIAYRQPSAHCSCKVYISRYVNVYNARRHWCQRYFKNHATELVKNCAK